MRRLRPIRLDDVGTPKVEARAGTHSGVASSSVGVQALTTQGQRGDAPVLRNLRRGSFNEAAAVLAHGGTGPLLDDLLLDRHARSSVASKASWINTWRRFHDLAFADSSPPVPMLPITPRTLVHVSSLFKAGGYRGYPNYLSAVKSLHIDAGFEWDQLLSHTGTWVSRSVLRGIGPARQSCSFQFAELCKLVRSTEPLVTGGPYAPYHFTILACIFLLREVEVANALTNSWCFDHVAMELSWTLPTGKSDHMALGTVRTWGCLCAVPELCCPYHLALEHWSWLVASTFLKPGVASPLFPSVGGGASSKISVVATFEALGSLLGQPLFNATGVRLFGGHSPRVTGAQALAAAGIEINKIRILARHSGETILRYVAEAPLKSLRSDLGLIAARSCTGTTHGSSTNRDVASGVLSGSTASSSGFIRGFV